MVKNNKINSNNISNYRNVKADYAYNPDKNKNNNPSPYANFNTYGKVMADTKFVDTKKTENLLSKSHENTHYYNPDVYMSAHGELHKELKPKENNLNKVSSPNTRPRVLNPVSAVNDFKSSMSTTTLVYEQGGRYYVEAGEDFSYYTSQNGADNAETEGPAVKDSAEFHERYREPVLVTVRKGDLVSIDNPYDMRCIHEGDKRYEALFEDSNKRHAYAYRELRDTAEFRNAENGLADAVILGGDEICKQATALKGAGAKEITDPVVGASVLSRGGGCSELLISPSSRSGGLYDAVGNIRNIEPVGVDVRDIGPDGRETILSIPSNNGVPGSSKTFYVDASAFSEDSKNKYIEFSQQGPGGPSGPGGAGDGISLSAEKGEHSISSSSRYSNVDWDFGFGDNEPSKDDGPDF